MSIAVSVAAFRDPELLATLSSLFSEASVPERIFTVICLQDDAEGEKKTAERLGDLPVEWHSRVRVVLLGCDYAKGPCLARRIIQEQISLWNEQRSAAGKFTYYLQIDSHMRFCSAWDEILLAELLRTPHPAKSIISGYPGAYTVNDQGDVSLSPDTVSTVVTCASHFDRESDGMLRLCGKELLKTASADQNSVEGQNDTFKDTETLLHGLFFAAGFAFMMWKTCALVPYDGTMSSLFFGEEASMTVRFFTSGVDIFHPSRVVAYHLWSRKGRPVFKPDCAERELSIAHVRKQLNGESVSEMGDTSRHVSAPVKVLPHIGSAETTLLTCVFDGPLGLGKERSLADFERLSQVDFKNRLLGPRAFKGGLPENTRFREDSQFSRIFSDIFCCPGVKKVRSDSPAVPLDSSTTVLSTILGFLGDTNTQKQEHIPALSISARFKRRPRFSGVSELAASHVESLNTNGFVVVDDFLSLSEAQWGQVTHEFEGLALRPACVGASLGQDATMSVAVRSDKMVWLRGGNDLTIVQEKLRRLTGSLMTGLKIKWDLSLMATKYSPGAFYLRHCDVPLERALEGTRPRRFLTVLLYLSAEDWCVQEGGTLRIYPPTHPCSPVDVVPRRGRLVVFVSDCIEHEVLPVTGCRERLAVGGWVYTL